MEDNSKVKSKKGDLELRICPACGKKFIIHCMKDEYVYKLKKRACDRYKYYCSYSCWRKEESKITKIIKRRERI